MPELLLELFSEEIPARMQARAADDLKRLVSDGLKAEGLEIGKALAYATPRRLCLVIEDVPDMSPAISEERKGPRVDAPEKAIQGFLRGAGLSSIDEAEIVTDPKKGDFYVARREKPGRPAKEIIAQTILEVCNKFPWPKSMRWGSHDFNWVRPLHGIICILGGEVVPFEIAGVTSGNQTRGHRFHGKAPFTVTNFEDYGRKLLDAKVLLPASERAASIAEQAEEVAKAAGLELVEDKALELENAGLTEWPTVLMGTFEKDFLDVPAECLTSSMKAHQKCFSLRDPKTGQLTNRFLLVTNLIAADSGKEIIAGNEKVIRARLSDAKFFWDQDLKRPLDEMAVKLADVTFHEKLGTQKDRVERVAELAAELAESVDAPKEDARRAAQLCKADLVSEMVGEFPELQGLMGRYYAEKAGTKPAIAKAIEEHYKPKGAGDTVPTDPVSIAVALADKLDTLVGFWAIDEKPTGSGDPYQLRRAALGVIRIVLENDLRVRLHQKINRAIDLLPKGEQSNTVRTDLKEKIVQWRGDDVQSVSVRETPIATVKKRLPPDLLSFFADRLKVHLREEGVRHDLIDAVFALPGQDDLALVVKRVEALAEFLETDDGENLLAGAKRAANILAIEEKKDATTYDGTPDGKLLSEPEERALEAAIAKVMFDTRAAIDVENFEGAMRALAELRNPVDAFFEKVKVNDDDPKVRENRLKMLAQIRTATLTVADFSKIAG
jgi:glycyl-tRNA synthetase beta chain